MELTVNQTDTETPNDSFYSKPEGLVMELFDSRTSEMKFTHDSKAPLGSVVLEGGGDNTTSGGNWHNEAQKQLENFGNVYLSNLKSPLSDKPQVSNIKTTILPI